MFGFSTTRTLERAAAMASLSAAQRERDLYRLRLQELVSAIAQDGEPMGVKTATQVAAARRVLGASL